MEPGHRPTLDYAPRPPVPSNLHLKWVIRGLWVLAALAAVVGVLLWLPVL